MIRAFLLIAGAAFAVGCAAFIAIVALPLWWLDTPSFREEMENDSDQPRA